MDAESRVSHGTVTTNCQDNLSRGRRMKSSRASFAGWSSAVLLIAIASDGSVLAESPDDQTWSRVVEDDRAIKIETDRLEAIIAKKAPKQWMTGIEKGS